MGRMGRDEAHLGRTEHHRRVHGCACVAGTSPLSCPEEKGAIYACRRCTCALKLEKKKKKKKSGGGTITTSNNINNGSRGKKHSMTSTCFSGFRLCIQTSIRISFVASTGCARLCVYACEDNDDDTMEKRALSYRISLSFFLFFSMSVWRAW